MAKKYIFGFTINMNISFYPSNNFTGRASIIKEADQICRSVNNKFPHSSPYMDWNKYHQPVEHYQAFIPLWKKLDEMRNATMKTDTAYDYYDVLIQKMQKFKCANCDDLCDIVYLKCKNKNYENVRFVQLAGVNPDTNKKVMYDHIAIEFTHKGKKVLIDPLFGFADFVPNCFLKYKGIFKSLIDGFEENLKIDVFKSDEVKIHPEDLNYLTRKYRELIG